ncbi:MAG: ThiF family adenylyltransferase [Protaetiibacter sp.]
MPLPPLVDPVDTLTDAERRRTARHTRLAGFRELAQRRLRAGHVAVVGAGGLGSPVVLALAAAGVGTLTIIDDDIVEVSNLHRQVIHRMADAGRAKTASAVRVAAELSPETVVHAVGERLEAHNAERLLAGAHLVIDGTDTFETRLAVAGACEALGIPLVWGTVQGFDAQVTVFWSDPPAGAPAVRLADLYPEGSVGELPSCSDVGVLGAFCLQVGSLLATEAIKLLTGVGESLLGRVLVLDALRGRQSEVTLRSSSLHVGMSAPTAASATPRQLTASEALLARQAGATLLDVREPWETAQGTVDGSLLVPLGRLLADPTLVGAGPVVVMCAHGVRARTAAEALAGAGLEAGVLAGGLAAWPELLDDARAGASAW